MEPRPHQLSQSEEGLKVLDKFNIVYLASEERTGKTLTAILMAEESEATTVLIVSKKGKPLEGWSSTIKAYGRCRKIYRVINYHSIHKLDGLVFDLVILDEAHNYISSFPKHSSLWDKVASFTANTPIIYVSATPHAQGRQGLYGQLALSNWSPWRDYRSGYSWFKEYGVPTSIRLHGRYIETYKKFDDERIRKETDHLFLTQTRKDIGFEHEPEDVLHYVELSDHTKTSYNHMMNKKVIQLDDNLLMLDTAIKLRTSLHMLEGGVAKINIPGQVKLTDRIVEVKVEHVEGLSISNVYYNLDNKEKIDYILAKWGDTEDLAIMYNYRAERHKLSKYFSRALLLQSTTNAEGIDLYHVKDLVIYSQDFSTARHTQRRARQANKKRDTPIRVNFLLVKEAVSAQVYKIVSLNKLNFVDSLFDRKIL